MTEDEYVRYLVYVWKKNYPSKEVIYPIDDGCNCLHRTYWEMENVEYTSRKCHCALVGLGFHRAGMRYVWNSNPFFDERAKEESIQSWFERMRQAVR